MRRLLIASAKSLFPTLSGYILHPILVLEAVQACPLIFNAGNALQQVLQDAFRGTHFVERLSCRSTVADVQGTPFRSKKGRKHCTLSTVEPPPMSCVLCGRNSRRFLSHLHHRRASSYSRGRALSSSVLVIRVLPWIPKPSLRCYGTSSILNCYPQYNDRRPLFASLTL